MFVSKCSQKGEMLNAECGMQNAEFSMQNGMAYFRMGLHIYAMEK